MDLEFEELKAMGHNGIWKANKLCIQRVRYKIQMVNILYIKLLNKGKFLWVIGFCCFSFSEFDEEVQPQERAIQNQEVKIPNNEHDLV